MTTELIIRNTLPVKSIAELQTIGQLFEQSGMFGCKQQGQGIILAMTCHLQNMTPLEFLENYNLIDGKPSKKADAMLAKLMELGGSFKIIKRTIDEAAIECTYKGNTYTSSFTWKEAQEEPYVYEKDGKTFKRNWRTPRARQQSLWARVCSDAIRTVCPQANKGTATPEEMQDLIEDIQPTTLKNITPEIIPQSEIQNVEPEIIEVVPEQGEAQPAETPQIDFNIIPIGDMAGKIWADLPIERLKKLLTVKHKKITAEHLKFAKAELARKEAENGK